MSALRIRSKGGEQLDAKKKKLIFLLVRVFVTVLAAAIALGLVAPVYFVIIRSVSPSQELFPIRLLPSGAVFDSFSEMFNGTGVTGLPFTRNFFAAFVVSLVTVAVQVPVVCAMAYVLAKVRAPGIRALDRVIEWAMVLTPLSVYVPQYFIMLKLGISDSFFALILPFAASPLSVFLLKRYMSVVPDDMVYSARLEGASHFRICFGLVMPNIKPAISAVAVLSLGNMWSYSGELFVHSEGVKPLGALMPLFSRSEEYAGVLCAAAVVIIVPIIILTGVFGKEIGQIAQLAGLKPSPHISDKEKRRIEEELKKPPKPRPEIIKPRKAKPEKAKPEKARTQKAKPEKTKPEKTKSEKTKPVKEKTDKAKSNRPEKKKTKTEKK